MDSIESRFVIGPSNILSAGVYVCTFRPGNFTGCSNEGVKAQGQGSYGCHRDVTGPEPPSRWCLIRFPVVLSVPWVNDHNTHSRFSHRSVLPSARSVAPSPPLQAPLTPPPTTTTTTTTTSVHIWHRLMGLGLCPPAIIVDAPACVQRHKNYTSVGPLQTRSALLFC